MPQFQSFSSRWKPISSKNTQIKKELCYEMLGGGGGGRMKTKQDVYTEAIFGDNHCRNEDGRGLRGVGWGGVVRLKTQGETTPFTRCLL